MEYEIRTGWRVILFGFGSFLAWGSLAPLDQGIPAAGVIASESSRKQVSHVTGGIIEQIAVKEGQLVKKGDLLVRLDEAQSLANLKAAQSQWWTALAVESRLQAEIQRRPSLAVPEALREQANLPEIAAILKTQKNVLQARRAASAGEMRLIRESKRGLENQLRSLQNLKTSRERQVALFDEQMASARSLQAQGYLSRNQALDVERQLSEVHSRQSEDLSNINAIQARLAELELRESQYLIDQRREIEAELAEVRRDLTALAERVAAFSDTHERLAIRAPVSGTIVNLAVATVGGVLKSGDRVLDIVPDGDELIVEAKVDPRYIDRIYAGLQADLRFDAYLDAFQRPIVAGDVEVVSADAMSDEKTGVTYYKVRVTIPPTERELLSSLKLQPGMPCTVMIKTGEHSLLTYLVQPLMRRFVGALAEP
jgi:protease secretion system membrane fusion protein